MSFFLAALSQNCYGCRFLPGGLEPNWIRMSFFWMPCANIATDVFFFLDALRHNCYGCLFLSWLPLAKISGAPRVINMMFIRFHFHAIPYIAFLATPHMIWEDGWECASPLCASPSCASRDGLDLPTYLPTYLPILVTY